MDNKVLSGDSHIDLRFMPENTFLDNAPTSLKDRMPHIEETEQGLRWLADGCDLGVVGTFVAETQSTEMNERTRLMVEGGFFEDQDIGWHPTNVELRLRDQDKDGIEGEVMYGLLRIGQQLTDSNLITEIFKLYNNWVADFCKQAPGRFAALACIPSHDPDVAAEELTSAHSSVAFTSALPDGRASEGPLACGTFGAGPSNPLLRRRRILVPDDSKFVSRPACAVEQEFLFHG